MPSPTTPARCRKASAATSEIREKLNLGGLVNDQNRELSNCTNGAPALESCGTAPDIKNITAWLNTPDGAAIDLKSLRGKVVLVDFWAYSCINCQRAIPHIVDWYDTYRDSGFEVIGVHTPEYAFERVEGNVTDGARDLGITYPVALGQRILHVDELPQPVLAGQVSDRRHWHRAPHQVR